MLPNEPRFSCGR